MLFSDGSEWDHASIEVTYQGLSVHSLTVSALFKDGAKSTTDEGNSYYDEPSYKCTLLDDGRVEVIEDPSKGSTKKHYIIPEQ